MSTVLQACFLLVLQLAAGGTILSLLLRLPAPAGWYGVRVETSRHLARMARIGIRVAALLGVGIYLGAMGWPWNRQEPVPTLLYLSCGAVSAAGCYLILHAGWRERQGQIEASRQIVRFGGWAMVAGTATQLAFAPWLPWGLSDPPRPAVLGVALAAHAVSAFLGLLAGLAGKPRPSVYFAAALLLLGLVAYVAAFSRDEHPPSRHDSIQIAERGRLAITLPVDPR